MAPVAQRRMHPAGDTAVTDRGAVPDPVLCRPLQHGSAAQCDRLCHAAGHARQAASRDPRRPRSQAGAGSPRAATAPAPGGMTIRVTMTVPGETEAGNAGKQPCRGIAWRAHRDDEAGASELGSAPLPNLIGSKDPHALKIPARRAEYSLTEDALSPFQAEPRHPLPLLTTTSDGTSRQAI